MQLPTFIFSRLPNKCLDLKPEADMGCRQWVPTTGTDNRHGQWDHHWMATNNNSLPFNGNSLKFNCHLNSLATWSNQMNCHLNWLLYKYGFPYFPDFTIERFNKLSLRLAASTPNPILQVRKNKCLDLLRGHQNMGRQNASATFSNQHQQKHSWGS